MDLVKSNELIKRAMDALHQASEPVGNMRVGVDLGTAYIVLVVIDDLDNPIAVEMKFAQVLKDGLVVDYSSACKIVEELKLKLETRIGRKLDKAAIAIPPGTSVRDANTHRYVVESAGFEVLDIVDEPTAANCVMGLKDGVIVDIGGGTTGLSILEGGKVVYVADEATGGTHVSLVIAGHFKISFEEAEAFKCKEENYGSLFGVVKPVFEKMASIVKQHIRNHDVDNICLVGGTCLFPGIENVFEQITGIKTYKPDQPLMVTPLGIALSVQRME